MVTYMERQELDSRKILNVVSTRLAANWMVGTRKGGVTRIKQGFGPDLHKHGAVVN